MQKPDFKGMKTLFKAINDADSAFRSIYSEGELQENEVRRICRKISAQKGREALRDYSVQEFKNAKAGIRVAAIENAGYKSLWDVATASDMEIHSIDGIGEKQIEAMRGIVTEFANSLSAKVSIKLSAEGDSEQYPFNNELITALARLISSDKARGEGREIASQINSFATRLGAERVIKNGVHWLFSGNDLKQHTLNVYADMYNLCNSEYFQQALGFLDRYHAAANTTETAAQEIFKRNAADFYAVLERLGTGTGNKPFVYGSIPAQLAQEIDQENLDLSEFTGNLRTYQSFGAKYILHQKYVLLGDEMGLGKTVQAIAAMSHINKTAKDCHFLVVCPASVLVNWAREIKKFSCIQTIILHGQDIKVSFAKWQEQGGAAITNYESMGKIVDAIDNHMSLEMLVIDEAHFIKNPDAKRTVYIRRLDNESKRILLMTGTPLENRVEEMCNLLDFVRPDMVKEITALAHMSHLPEFKEKLSPVYLRRTRDQVLEELPPIDERQVWCGLTPEDRAAYMEAYYNHSFVNMRRISFLQDDIGTSSKITRLLELCLEAEEEGRKVVVYSFFRDTISKVSKALGNKCAGEITGDTKVELRQDLIDRFSAADGGNVLVCQIQAGGVGLNIQAASIVMVSMISAAGLA